MPQIASSSVAVEPDERSAFVRLAHGDTSCEVHGARWVVQPHLRVRFPSLTLRAEGEPS